MYTAAMSNIESGETRGSAAAREWAAATAKRIGGAVAHYREKRGITAVELSSRTSQLGYPITRGTIAKMEGGHRGGKFDVVEVFVLAVALEVPPALLLFPEFPDGSVSPVPTSDLSSFRASNWLVGDEKVTWRQPELRYTPEGVAYTVGHQSDEERLLDLARQRGKTTTMDESMFQAFEVGSDQYMTAFKQWVDQSSAHRARIEDEIERLGGKVLRDDATGESGDDA
ncbi:hypothetical protein CH298_13150 [Rhodococcoides fascians]|nr:hypothetical protein CH303_13030 [Rhodococcus fascians]OZF18235.1 hypothetical protein CH298_13150 [Rhodococcus fascians]OZF21686.1 hypothetical protein CH297_13045 [Rhodococcus fascians]OZF67311.1 hypothetical protein CH308_12945 [Rhodococcus fascians]OZF70500.1 hypothetical protein CH307_13140 [Rhodococcus fascians]